MICKKNSPEVGITGLNSISETEAEVMNIAWKYKSFSVRQIYEELLKKEIMEKDHDYIPYSTIVSAVSSLTKKGILRKSKGKKTYIYTPVIEREKLAGSIIKTVGERLLDGTLNNLVSRLIEKPESISLQEIKKYLDKIPK